MPEITDIIHRITYQIEDQELIAATNEVQKTIGKIASLTNILGQYESKLKSTSRLEISERKAIQAQIDRTKKAIELQTGALESQIISNKKLQTAISQEIGLIGRLNAQMDLLKQKRDIANDPSKIQAYNREIAATQSQLNKLTGAQSGGSGGGFASSILQGLGIGTGIGLLTQGISGIKEFIGESSKLAAEMEGVSVAFNRLNDPKLLEQLREATRGTVSDLELMKSAVQFNNFGLPVNQLATALEFARIRAKETGVTVDYLVESITTGIGRQSPLILDNLGINAKRVREEFQKTGDFAEAAFKIIQEESAKAGKDLETFAEKQARVNAQIQNTQAIFGKFVNDQAGFFASFLIDLFQNQVPLATSQYIESIKDRNQAENDAVDIAQNSQALFIQNFEQFTKQYASADIQSRGVIKEQQKDLYNTLIEEARKFYGKDLKEFEFYAQSLQQAQVKAQAAFKAQGLNLKTLDPSSVKGLSLDELEAIQEEIKNRSALTSANTEDIKKRDLLNEAVQKEIDIINGTAYKNAQKEAINSSKDRKKNADELREALEKLNEEIRKSLKTPTDDKKPKLDPLGFPIGEPSGNAFGSLTPDQQAFNRADAGRGSTFETAEQIAARKAKQKEAKEKQKETLNKIVGYYEQAAQSIIGTFQMINDAKIQALDFELEVTQSRIIAATELAKRGNASVLEDELNNLNKLSEEREKLANRQLAINSLLQASGAALAAVQAIQTVTNAGTTGDPYTIPIRIAAAVAALASGVALVTGIVTAARGFKDGVIGLDGAGTATSDSIAARLSKGESVITAEKTQRYRPVLEAIHAGTFERSFPTYNNYASKTEMKGVERKLDRLIELNMGGGTEVKNMVSGGDLVTVTQKHALRKQNRWKRG